MKISTAIKQYTEFKIALGNGFCNERRYLRIFSEQVGDKALDGVTEEDVQTFLLGPGGRVTPTYRYRFAPLNGLFKFAIARGYCSRSPLPKILPKKTTNFTPYIYSVEELKRLLLATDQVDINRSCVQIEPETLRMIILLLYGATLRISEALSLNIDDVDLEQGVLTIRESKFYKTRIVPIGSNLTAALSEYARLRHGKKSLGRFLVGRLKKPLLSASVGKKFCRLRKSAGLRRHGGDQPRLHDLRHAGAVHRIIAWYRAGKDVQKLLPLLSTYMGHGWLRDTQVYLTVVPEIMELASLKFERYALSGVSP
jgi:site-specific recombinase XerD